MPVGGRQHIADRLFDLFDQFVGIA
jgi:hypothetical protein